LYLLSTGESLERSKNSIGKQLAGILVGQYTGRQQEVLKKKKVQFKVAATCIFQLQEGRKEDIYIGKYRISRIVDKFILLSEQFDIFRVSTVYKKKADKVQLVDLGISDSSKPGGVRD
jgi:hypothetical protein